MPAVLGTLGVLVANEAAGVGSEGQTLLETQGRVEGKEKEVQSEAGS